MWTPAKWSIGERGLAWFVLTIVVAVVVLSIDWYLHTHGYKTITEYVEDYPWVGRVIIVFLASGVAGLAVHFMNPD